jgi:hypothetical protein
LGINHALCLRDADSLTTRLLDHIGRPLAAGEREHKIRALPQHPLVPARPCGPSVQIPVRGELLYCDPVFSGPLAGKGICPGCRTVDEFVYLRLVVQKVQPRIDDCAIPEVAPPQTKTFTVAAPL